MTTEQEKMDKMATKRLQHIIYEIIKNQIFFAHLILNMKLVQDPTRVSIAADGREIRYSPTWINTTPADQIRFALTRIVLSCALKHHTRRQGRNYENWQLASYLVTLPMLRECGLTNHTGGLNTTIQQAYNSLPPPEVVEITLPLTGCAPEGDEGNPEAKSTPTNVETSEEFPAKFAMQGEVLDSPATDPNARDKSDDSDQTKPTPSQRIQQEEQKWDEAMLNAQKTSISQGNMPGHMSKLIDNAFRSMADWKTILRRFMTSNSKADFSWTYPNLRLIDSGLYLPSLHSYGMPPIVFAVDNSGSVDNESLAQIWTEIKSVASELNPTMVTVIQCDTQINSIQRYHPSNLPEKMEAIRGGGTSFYPIFDYLKDQEVPSCLIYCTDLQCNDKPPTPDFPVLWAVVNYNNVPDIYFQPFGEVISIKD